MSYILIQTDSGDHSFLLLLDLGSAFDTVGHGILIERQLTYLALVLAVFLFNLSNRHLSVMVGNGCCCLELKSVSRVLYWPYFILYLHHIPPLGLLTHDFNVSFIFTSLYADDTHVYCLVKTLFDLNNNNNE